MDFNGRDNFNPTNDFNDLIPDRAELEAIDFYQKAAMVTLDIGKLDKYKESIDRSHKKIEILNPSRSF